MFMHCYSTRKTLMSFLLLILSMQVHAQQETGSLMICPKVGLNIASCTNNDGYSPRVGLVAGLDFQYQIVKRFACLVGLHYSMQGLEGPLPFTDNWMYSVNRTKMDYINIPILAKFYVYKGLSVNAGIQPGFNVISKTKNSTFYYPELDPPTAFKANTFDFSIPLGISFEFQNVVLDARYNFGLTKMAKNVSNVISPENDSDIDAKNRVFQFSVGYKF